MVGIPRSKACKACRARRKKCDEARPRCGLCKKRNIQCEYRTDLPIVLVNPGAKSARPVLVKSSDSEDSYWAKVTLVELPPTCYASAHRAKVQGSFVDLYIPEHSRNALSPSNAGATTSYTDWLLTAYQLAADDELVSDSLDAVSIAYFQRKNNLDASLQDRRTIYGKAMRSVVKRLNSEQALTDNTLAAVLFLAQYEAQTLDNVSMTSWLEHIKGALAIIESRGAKNFETNFGYQLFLGTRMMDLINSLGSRKAVKIPSLNIQPPSSERTTPFLQLANICLTVPSILELGDQIVSTITSSNPDDLRARVSKLSYISSEFHARLDSWESQLELSSTKYDGEGPLMWEEPSAVYASLPKDSPARLYETYTCFKSVDIAQQMVTKWACLVLIDCFAILLEQRLREHMPLDISIYATDTERHATLKRTYRYAEMITRALEFLVQPNVGIATIEVIGLPINVAYGFWNAQDAKQKHLFPVVLSKARHISQGFADMLSAMTERGGGGAGFRGVFYNDASISSTMPSAQNDAIIDHP